MLMGHSFNVSGMTPHAALRRFWMWLAVVVVFLIALWLGYVGFAKYHLGLDAGLPLLDNFYLSCQLFVLKSGSVRGPIPWELQVARFLAPMVPAWTVFSAMRVLLSEQFRMVFLRFRKNHVVICGLGRKGLQLVKDCRASGHKVVVIDRVGEEETVRVCRDLGALVLIGDAADKTMLRQARVHRAHLVFAVTGDDGTNVETAVLTYQLVEESKRSSSNKVCCHVHVFDLTLCDVFKQHNIFKESGDAFEAQVFNIFEHTTQRLLMDHPLDREPISREDDTVIHLIIVGLGQMGESVALEAAHSCHFANLKRPRITIIDTASEEVEKSFLGRYPQFGQVCDLSFVRGDASEGPILDQIKRWASEDSVLTSIAVCLDNDSRSLHAALSIMNRLGESGVHLYVRMAEEATLATLLDSDLGSAEAGATTIPFGMFCHVCRREDLLDKKTDKLASAIHERYVKQRLAEGPASDEPGMRDWAKLGHVYRESNRHQSNHIPVKLRAVNCIKRSSTERGDGLTSFERAEIELMAEMEHTRWCAERILDGWSHGTEKDEANKTHPDLKEYRALDEGTKDLDRQTVGSIPELLEGVQEKVCRLAPVADSTKGAVPKSS